MNPTLRHATEALRYRLVGPMATRDRPADMKLSNTLVMPRGAGRRLAGCGIGRMSPTPRVGTISR